MKPSVWSSPPTNRWPRSLEISASTTRRSGTGSVRTSTASSETQPPGRSRRASAIELTGYARRTPSSRPTARSCARRQRILPGRRCGEPLSLRLRVRPRLRGQAAVPSAEGLAFWLLHLVPAATVAAQCRDAERPNDRRHPSALAADLWCATGPRRAAPDRPALRSQAGGAHHGRSRPGGRPCPPALAHRQARTAPLPTS